MITEARRQYSDEYLATVPESVHMGESDRTLRDDAIRLHLTDPSITASDLAMEAGLSLDEVRSLYKGMQDDETIRRIITSPYYPRKMMTLLAESTIRDWTEDPDYANRILRGDTVAARNLEVHATRGTCDYTCTMCLWSDKEELTYSNLGLREFGLMDSSDWFRVFESAKDLGTQRIVFSGGGEPLLNKDLFRLSTTARGLGLKTQLYTNGFGLSRASEQDWDEVIRMEQIRFSMHSPTDDIYNHIVTMPEGVNALPTVTENIRELLARRHNSGSPIRVGIGFVTQALNYRQIEDMVDFAQSLGVDFINLRQDEVEVTRDLSNVERRHIGRQLSSVRDRALRGGFGHMQVDMSDDMVALANGIEQQTRRVASCFAKILRPAVSPFGVVAPCDLRAEPRFSDPNYILGNIKRQTLPLIMSKATRQDVDASCAQCMPSGRTINAIVTKLFKDYEVGIDFRDQPFARV